MEVGHVNVVARGPETSRQAALDFEQSKAQRSVQVAETIIRNHGPMTDFAIRALWGSYWGEKFSDSLPCKARHWAREAGLVRFAGFGKHNNRKVRLWGIGRDAEFLLTQSQCCPLCGHKKGRAS